MKRWLLLIAFTGILGTSYAQVAQEPRIEVNGVGELEVEPDEIFLNIVLSESEVSKRDVADLERDLKKVLKSEDVSLANLEVESAQSGYKDRWWGGKKIHVSKSYRLKLKNVNEVDGVISELKGKGISHVRVTHAQHSQIEKLELQAKIMALKNAKSKAEALAKAVDQEVGAAILIQERQSYGPRRYNAVMMKEGGAVDPNEEALTFRKLKIRMEVYANFRLL